MITIYKRKNNNFNANIRANKIHALFRIKIHHKMQRKCMQIHHNHIFLTVGTCAESCLTENCSQLKIFNIYVYQYIFCFSKDYVYVYIRTGATENKRVQYFSQPLICSMCVVFCITICYRIKLLFEEKRVCHTILYYI